MQLTEKHKQYWNINLKISTVLLVVWFVATFVMGWFARELNDIILIGPLGFYMSAQGSLDHLRRDHRLLRLLHEQPGQGIRRP
jgi:uncharacterized membrane protein